MFLLNHLHMKKILLFSAMALFLTSINTVKGQAGETMKFKGQQSPDSENEDNEPDPKFSVLMAKKSFQAKTKSTGTAVQHVSELENGVQIVKDILDKLIGNEYKFSLISQHKYMVNGCLGVKVSAGEFELRFSKPVVEIGSSGKLTIRLEVDKIYFSAFKIRTKPCTKPLHALDPCHFGGKFEIGGEATNLKMRAEIDPIANGVVGTQGFCFFAFQDNVKVNWSIGGFNLRPMPNILDNVGKDMVEDALNGGMVDLFYNKFIELSKDVIPQYYSACENAYNLTSIADDIVDDVVPANPNNNNNNTSAAKWEIKPAEMKGVMGRLSSDFPSDVEWSINIYTTENKFLRNHSKVSKMKYYNLAPGNYNIKLNTVPVENVPIEKGKETRLKAGFLDIVSEGNWELRSESKEKFLTSGNKPQKLALPVGSYQLKLGTQFFPVSIKDGATVEF